MLPDGCCTWYGTIREFDDRVLTTVAVLTTQYSSQYAVLLPSWILYVTNWCILILTFVHENTPRTAVVLPYCAELCKERYGYWRRDHIVYYSA